MWGVTLDAIGAYEVATGWFTWRRHSFYFGVLLLIDIIAFFAVSSLRESPRGDREGNVVAGRLRRLSRIWMR